MGLGIGGQAAKACAGCDPASTGPTRQLAQKLSITGLASYRVPTAPANRAKREERPQRSRAGFLNRLMMHRLRAPGLINGNIGEHTLGHAQQFTISLALHPCFDVDLHRGAPDFEE